MAYPQEMSRELARISQVVDEGDEGGGLQEKMSDAEQAKADVEGKITEKVTKMGEGGSYC